MSLIITGINLKKIVKQTSLTQEEAAKRLGITRQTLSSWFKYDKLDNDILQNVKTNLLPLIDTKVLDMAKDESAIPTKKETNQIPMYNLPAAAGEVELYNNPNDVKIVGYLNIPGAHKESFALPAYGHSMYPTIANGDWAVSRPINDPSEIVWGEIYYIEWSDYKMFKRLLHTDIEDEVTLWSDNQLDKIGDRPKYAAITIKKKKIRKLCLVTEILKKPNY